MLVAESMKGRRIVGRLEGGVDLQVALAGVCSDHGVRAAAVRVRGVLDEAEVVTGPSGTSRTADGPLAIAHLEGMLMATGGRLGLRATCVLTGDDGAILAGRVENARVGVVEFLLETFDDLVLQADDDPGAPGLLLDVIPLDGKLVVASPRPAPVAAAVAAPAPVAAPVAVAAPAPARAPAAGSEPSWADVAARSSMIDRQKDDERRGRALSDAAASAGPAPIDDEPAPEVPLRSGDFIDHPRFGRCEVVRVEGDQEYAQVMLKNGRMVRFALEMLVLSRISSDEKGRRTYRARIDT